MSYYLGEFLGTMILILLGDGVVAPICGSLFAAFLFKTFFNKTGDWLIKAAESKKLDSAAF